jgi:cell wall-associated NlpC family hydrolase
MPPARGLPVYAIAIPIAVLCALPRTLSAQPVAAAPEPAGPVITAVHLVSRLRGAPHAPADATPKRARLDTGVILYAVLEVEVPTGPGRPSVNGPARGRGPAHGRERRRYSDAGRVRLGNRVHATLPMDQAPAAELRWYKVEPTSENLSNTATGSFRFETIPYAETEVMAWRSRPSADADVRPTRTTDRGRGRGTMRYKLVAITPSGTLATPGAEARGDRGSGLSDRVHRVSLRRDDGYLGMLDELFGQPYIWASGGQPDARHQAERMEGADCADFVVYGMRRMGHRISYTWSEGLREHGRRLGAGTLRADGVYVDAGGAPLPFPQPGDLLLFPRHVGALSQDRGVPGVLDSADLMMHTLFASPREEPIADSGYADTPVEIRRWTEPRPAAHVRRAARAARPR